LKHLARPITEQDCINFNQNLELRCLRINNWCVNASFKPLSSSEVQINKPQSSRLLVLLSLLALEQQGSCCRDRAQLRVDFGLELRRLDVRTVGRGTWSVCARSNSSSSERTSRARRPRVAPSSSMRPRTRTCTACSTATPSLSVACAMLGWRSTEFVRRVVTESSCVSRQRLGRDGGGEGR
jgi:hypothetical protein